jgi:hypothetical protein
MRIELDHWTEIRHLEAILPPFLLLLLAGQLIAWIVLLPGGLRGLADFRQLYAAGSMVDAGRGHELYNYEAQKLFQNELVPGNPTPLPFIRPAYQALLFVPFSRLSYRAAYLLFLACNMLLFGVCFLLLRSKLAGLASRFRWLPLALFCSFLPVSVALLQGQDTIILMVLLASAMVLLDRDRDFFAGSVVAFGLFKLQLVLPIFFLFVVARRWRFASGFAAAGALVSSISLWVVGFEGARVFLMSILSVGSGAASESHAVGVVFNTTYMANLRGLVAGVAGGVLGVFWLQAISVGLSGTALVFIAVWSREKLAGRRALELAITTSAVVTYYFFIHDLSIVLIPMVLVLSRSIGAGEGQTLFDRLSAWFAAILLIAPLGIFLMPNHFYLVSLPLIGFLWMLLRGGKEAGRPREDLARSEHNALRSSPIRT